MRSALTLTISITILYEIKYKWWRLERIIVKATTIQNDIFDICDMFRFLVVKAMFLLYENSYELLTSSSRLVIFYEARHLRSGRQAA